VVLAAANLFVTQRVESVHRISRQLSVA